MNICYTSIAWFIFGCLKLECHKKYKKCGRSFGLESELLENFNESLKLFENTIHRILDFEVIVGKDLHKSGVIKNSGISARYLATLLWEVTWDVENVPKDLGDKALNFKTKC